MAHQKETRTPARKRASGGVSALNRREVASISGTALSAVDKAIEQGVLPRYRVKNETLIDPEGVVVGQIWRQNRIDAPHRHRSPGR
jgi:hypothetical protein